jgi:hypothetical protein
MTALVNTNYETPNERDLELACKCYVNLVM